MAETVPPTSTAETFTALDGASNQVHATWTHAGAHQAEAGFQDPELGWVSVRAGVNSGGISAVVVPGSADATEALGAHMAGLHDYLAEQHSPVDTLTLASSGNSGSDGSLNQGTSHQGSQHPGSQHPGSQNEGSQNQAMQNGEMQQQGQQQSAQDGRANAQTSNSISATSNATASVESAHMESTQWNGAESPAMHAGSGAGHISVMA